MADSRRSDLKAELRREIDSSSRLLVHTRSSVAKSSNSQTGYSTTAGQFREDGSQQQQPPAAGGSAASSSSSITGRGQSPARSPAFMRQFHSTAASSCIRNTPTRVVNPGSPRRGPGSPARATGRGRSPAAREVPVVAAATSANDSAAAGVETIVQSRAGPLARSAFEHHRGIVIPAEPGSSADHGDARMYTQKPLSNGSRSIPIKRQFPDKRSNSPAPEGATAAAASNSGTPSRRSDSPGGRKRINVPDSLDGPGARVTRDQPKRITGRHHGNDSRTNSPSRAPYFENAIEVPGAVRSGLLGYGPTGKGHSVRPEDHPRLLDEDTGKVGGEASSRGKCLIAGKSHTHDDPMGVDPTSDTSTRVEKFKPSVVVMHGPPAFVPPPPPQRTQSPRRGSGRGTDSDIFHVASPAPAPQQRQSTPVRVGRGMGLYSPARSDRPF